MSLKKCIGCKEEKTLDNFYPCGKYFDSRCKPCRAVFHKQYYENNRERIRKRVQELNKLPHRRAANTEVSRRMRNKFPEKYKARTAVGNALRNGSLKRKPCWCGETKVEAHHEDYSKPLDVVWLCIKHHMDLDGKRLVVE